MNQDQIIAVIEMAVGVLTILSSAFWGIRKWIYIPIKSLASTVDYTKLQVENYKDTLKELKPNGGGSLKDKVDKIAKNLDTLDNSVNFIKSLSLSHLNLLDSPVWQSDKDGNNIFINEAYKEFFEIDFESAKDYKWVALVHPEDLETYTKSWEESIKYKTDKDLVVRAIKFRTKQEVACKVSWRVTLNNEGDILYITGKIGLLNASYEKRY